MTVLLSKCYFDTRISTGLLFEEWPHSGIRRSIIGDAKFPARVKLALDGFNRVRENFQIRIVDGKSDGNERLLAKQTHAAARGCSIARRRSIKSCDPIFIRN